MALCTIALLNQLPLNGQTWHTVDDFQYYPGKGAWARGLAKDPSGTIIYSAGGGQHQTGVWHALVSQSADGGNTWSAIDDCFDATTPYGLNVYGYGAGIAADSAGRIYASGIDRVSTNTTVWLTRSSADRGQTWSTVDQLSAAYAQPQGLATDAAGNVYVAGWTNYLNSGGPNATWVIRKGTIDGSGGISWANVDAFRGANSQGARAYAVVCHPTAGIFSVGWGYVSVAIKGAKSKVQSISEWVVRRSQNGGASWSTVDTFSINSQTAIAQGVGIDGRGNIYVVGYAANPYNVWIVRKSSDGGSTWATVDSFQPSGFSESAQANGFACDVYGNLFVAGSSSESTGHKWIVRESQYNSVSGTWGPWQTVDSYQFTSAYAEADAVIGDSAGNVFVAGMCQDAQGNHWIVRKLGN